MTPSQVVDVREVLARRRKRPDPATRERVARLYSPGATAEDAAWLVRAFGIGEAEEAVRYVCRWDTRRGASVRVDLADLVPAVAEWCQIPEPDAEVAVRRVAYA